MEIPDWQCTATHCSFCGKHKDATKVLVIGPNDVGICDECVVVAYRRGKEFLDKNKCSQK
jgi:ATP-dependent protease Clp ATPase subunit